MASNRTLHKQISVALFCLRSARFDNDSERMEVAEAHMNRLLEKLGADNVLSQQDARLGTTPSH